ncbi:MAG: hypothetical protein JXR68_06855, partial [Bacteroidales bacterium]|nr:hypothetical protein [Bacteroidales bacterium]
IIGDTNLLVIGTDNNVSYFQSFNYKNGGGVSDICFNKLGGNVGIGTDEPSSSLHIYKYSNGAGNNFNNYPVITLEHNNNNMVAAWKIFSTYENELIFTSADTPYNGNKISFGDGSIHFSNMLTNGSFSVNSNGGVNASTINANSITSNILVLNKNGNSLIFNASNGNAPTGGEESVEIGSSTGVLTFSYPNVGLNTIVTGNIWSKEEIYVQNNDPWPDYVFNPNYNLMSIDSLDSFIQTNNHLPDVPSSDDITQNGMPVKEMNAILLQKIEELTLYIIDLQQQIDELKEEKNYKK